MKKLLTVLFAIAGVLIIVWAFMPSAIPVQTATIQRGTFVQSIEDDGKTRAKDVYGITSPVRGNLLRIELDAGDNVVKDQVVAKIIPATSQLLDLREALQLEERLGAAQAALLKAKVIADRAKAELEDAKIDLKRGLELKKKGFVSESELDKLQLKVELNEKEHQSALHNIESAKHDQKRIEYALKQFKRAYEPNAQTTGAVLEMTTPISGQIIKLYRESEGAIMSGEKIMDIADVSNIEIVTDILSIDAIKIPPNANVLIKRWGGKDNLIGRVRRVEPGGFTKISALGVEEQRVNVITDITSPKSAWPNLGAGFQLDTEIILYEHANQLLVPVSALFRDNSLWAVYVTDGKTAHKRAITLSDRNPAMAIVEKGLEAGEQVILYPGDRVKDGATITLRQ